MSYEPGSLDCRLLIDAKESLLNAMKSLSKIKDIDSIKDQLLSIYNELEEMHEIRRSEELKA